MCVGGGGGIRKSIERGRKESKKEEGIVKGKNAGRKSVCKEEHHRSREALGRLECMCVCVVGGRGGKVKRMGKPKQQHLQRRDSNTTIEISGNTIKRK